MFKQVTPVIDYSVRGLCCRPYTNHDKGDHIGCPNYNSKQGCPPGAELFDKKFDLVQPVFAIWNAFDFKSHVKRMKMLHSSWSPAQLACCYYWQPTARKQLTKELIYFMLLHPDYHVAVAFYKGLDKDLRGLYSRIIPSPPEAMGVEVGKTIADIGINIWPIEDTTYQIALAGRLL